MTTRLRLPIIVTLLALVLAACVPATSPSASPSSSTNPTATAPASVNYPLSLTDDAGRERQPRRVGPAIHQQRPQLRGPQRLSPHPDR